MLLMFCNTLMYYKHSGVIIVVPSVASCVTKGRASAVLMVLFTRDHCNGVILPRGWHQGTLGTLAPGP